MPLYTVTTQAGVLSGGAKARLADELATFRLFSCSRAMSSKWR